VSTDESGPDRRERYHRLLEVIVHNTGDPQHVLARGAAIWTVTHSSNIPTGEALTAMRAGLENGHVIRWHDPDGHHRYGLTADGVAQSRWAEPPLYGPADRAQLREVIETEAATADPDRAVIGWCNRRLAAIEEGDE